MNGQQSSTSVRRTDSPLIDGPVLASPSPPPRVLTVTEAARELRCSKAHVHHLIAGKVPGVRPLPSLWLGRRRLILRESFDEWIRANERVG